MSPWYPERRHPSTNLTVVLGFALPQYGQSARADLVGFAQTTEQLGADSLWVGDRWQVPGGVSLVDTLYVADDTDAHLEWVQRLLAR